MFFIDADSHIMPRDWMRHMPQSYQAQLPTYIFDEQGLLSQKSKLDQDPNPWSLNPAPLTHHNQHAGRYDIDQRLLDLPRLGVDFQVLNPDQHPMRLSYLVDTELAKHMCHSYNLTVLDIVSTHRQKFAANLMIPLQDMDHSLSQIDWGRDHGFTSVTIDTSWPLKADPASEPLAAIPGIDRLFAHCQDRRMLLVLHYQQHGRSINLRPSSIRLKLESLYPHPMLVALVSTVTSGLLDQYPDLRLLWSEGGMDLALSGYQYLTKLGLPDPMRYFRNNFYFTIETEDPEKLYQCVEKFGADHFLFATDYPHDDPGGAGRFQDRANILNMSFNAADQYLICQQNARRLFQLQV